MKPEWTRRDDARARPLSDQIRSLCEQFLKDLGLGRAPVIEELLPRIPAQERQQLLLELIAIQTGFDQAAGLPVDYTAYARRFPEVASAIDDLRGDFQLNNSRDGGFPVPLPNPPQISLLLNSSLEAGDSKEDFKTITFSSRFLRKIGNYLLLEIIGRGGSGEVYAARHLRLDRRDAVKLLSARQTGDAHARQRFYREMQSIGRLKHAHIVQAYDAGEVDGVPYLAMELVDGPNVELLARRMAQLKIADACEIVRQAALGLQHIFEHGMVHRDLKPSNLLLSSTGVKIADLGIALLRAPEAMDDRLTGTFVVMGTADYIAPEQTKGAHDVDIRADLYSLGCTFYRLLAGQAPFARVGQRTVVEKLRAHVHEPVPDIRTLRPDVPWPLMTILSRLLAKDPDKRYARPGELIDALTPYCADANLPALLDALSTERELTSGGQHAPAPATVQRRRSRIFSSVPSSRVLLLCVALLVLSGGLLLSPYIPRVDVREAPGPRPNSGTSTVSVASAGPHSNAPVTVTVAAPVDAPAPPPVLPRQTMIPQIAFSGLSTNSFFKVNEQTNKLHLVSDDLLMVQLGTLKQEDCDLEVSLEMNNDKSQPGEAGLFVGFRERPDLAQFQTLRLQTLPDASIVSRRELSTFQPQTPFARNSRVISMVPCTQVRRINTLHVQIIGGTLHQLSWNGQPVEKSLLATPDSSADNDFTGIFGVFSYKTVSVFSSLKVNGELQDLKP